MSFIWSFFRPPDLAAVIFLFIGDIVFIAITKHFVTYLKKNKFLIISFIWSINKHCCINNVIFIYSISRVFDFDTELAIISLSCDKIRSCHLYDRFSCRQIWQQVSKEINFRYGCSIKHPRVQLALYGNLPNPAFLQMHLQEHFDIGIKPI